MLSVPVGGNIVMHCVLSPYKDLTISAKLGGGIHFCAMGLPSGVFACLWETVNVPGLWLEIVKVLAIEVMVVSFEHPILWATGKEP